MHALRWVRFILPVRAIDRHSRSISRIEDTFHGHFHVEIRKFHMRESKVVCSVESIRLFVSSFVAM